MSNPSPPTTTPRADDHLRRLAVYGSLAPGQSNADQLAGLSGEWQPGVVRGRLVESGWGAAQGYPGLTPDPLGPEVRVQVFISDDLPAQWARLDAFEGDEYERVAIEVDMGTTSITAQIYALRPEP
ncbi:gamma-glutamylcyclotransferase family protein [Phenylobacterium sp.]|uniref:gamma-glutamylcyclotransferase family protein n=1 Tax=Phenylobacterium sp. TaxID=1871053 RepID=UPI003D2D449C